MSSIADARVAGVDSSAKADGPHIARTSRSTGTQAIPRVLELGSLKMTRLTGCGSIIRPPLHGQRRAIRGYDLAQESFLEAARV